MALTNIGTRVRAETVARLDALIPRLAARVPGADFTRSDAARAALERGVEVLEAELTPIPPPVAPAPPSTRKTSPKGGKPARKPK
jgi:hypothetical protein